MIDRRTFIGTAVAGAVMLSSRANSQSTERLPRIALVFNNASVAEMPDHRFDRAFVRGLREFGLVEGRNIVIERRSAEGRYDRLPGLIQEFLALPVDVIVAIGLGVGAARRATDTVPIVAIADGLVESGDVGSFARPGRNVTGLTTEIGLTELSNKRLQLLKEIAPKTSRVAFLGLLGGSIDQSWRVLLEAAARTLGQTIVWVNARTREDFEAGFAFIAKERANALLVDGSTANYGHTRSIVEFAARLRLPTIFGFREGPEAGGLMSYATDLAELYSRAATFVARILKGANPGDLPIEQPTKFDLVINETTARALGVVIPQSLLLNADVIG